MEVAEEVIGVETFVNPLCRFERVLALPGEGYCIFELLIRDGEILLNNIRVQQQDTGKGYATQGLTWLKQVAERTRSIVNGSIEPNGHMQLSRKQLAAWYTKNGFTVKGGSITYLPNSLY